MPAPFTRPLHAAVGRMRVADAVGVCHALPAQTALYVECHVPSDPTASVSAEAGTNTKTGIEAIIPLNAHCGLLRVNRASCSIRTTITTIHLPAVYRRSGSSDGLYMQRVKVVTVLSAEPGTVM